ncbi:ornithine carbamoyltransferase, catabolic [Halolamina pelagica]|uniref:Ornithine carbamoyltransferase, catabolic n=1 Tax=Halolamina pelagica TaxID=699431 RepID=A0A0P7HW34_9EURY|nr:ornithine carbamoyltransferase, catabolic [Halolamina pelagica]
MYDNDTEPTFPTDLLTIDQLSPAALQRLLNRSAAIKAGEEAGRLPDRTVAMVFENPSTRTRTSFEAGVTQLGGHPTFLGQDDIHLGHGEPIKDTARALSQYVDTIVARLHSHDDLTELAAYADVPVVNALTDEAHPCQTLADLLTLREIAAESGAQLDDTTLAWVGDGNNVARSLVVGCALAGVELRVATPAGYGVDDEAIAAARAAGGEPALFDSPRPPSPARTPSTLTCGSAWARARRSYRRSRGSRSARNCSPATRNCCTASPPSAAAR